MNMENNRDEDGEENGIEMGQSVTESNEYNNHTNGLENGDSAEEENERVGTMANVSNEREISVLAQTMKEEIDDDCDMGVEIEEYELSENDDGSTEREDEQIGSGANDAQNKVIRTPFCRMKESGPGPGYGIHCEKPDMPEEVFQNEKRIHFEKLTHHHENRNAVEADTRDKTKCNLWNAIVPKVILSQDFGPICKARAFKAHVKELTQRKSIGTKAQRHQNESQSVAMQQLGMQESLSIRSCGLFIDEGIIFLAASPTGMVNDSDMIIDIQCPLAITNKDPNDINVLAIFAEMCAFLIL
ncbi:hypothetical protein HA402_002269 [Bradysia odoriphaga]|nr:hypothetical protein HA402_002269 [Bradysia odoriphaga]